MCFSLTLEYIHSACFLIHPNTKDLEKLNVIVVDARQWFASFYSYGEERACRKHVHLPDCLRKVSNISYDYFQIKLMYGRICFHVISTLKIEIIGERYETG